MLTRRLDAIKAQNDQREYNSLVADVTRAQRAAGDGDNFLATTRLQLGMGAHVGVTMLLGFSLGAAIGSAFESYSPALVRADTAAGGCELPIPEWVSYADARMQCSHSHVTLLARSRALREYQCMHACPLRVACCMQSCSDCEHASDSFDAQF